MSASSLTIDVVSDVVCPWCFLGKHRLARALETVGDLPVTVHWRPFLLDPSVPEEGLNRDDYLVQKFGSARAVDETHRRLSAAGAAEGIDYRFDLIRRSPNTSDAHRLVGWASAAGVGDAVVEALFRAYFTEGRDVGDHAVLADIAAAAGLDREEIAARLASDIDRAEIADAIRHAAEAGITGVPCFVLAGRYAVMGAQPAETLAKAIKEVLAALEAAPAGGS